jgi:ketosteroid isomerase-like protein
MMQIRVVVAAGRLSQTTNWSAGCTSIAEMMDRATVEAPADVLARLTAAMNRQDLAAFVACFDPEYESEQPAHPDRLFRGRAQVERNWAAMFAGVPEFRAEVVRSAVAADTVWVEWRWTGSRGDGTRLDARGACIFGVRAGRLRWGRLYMEDVESGAGIEAAVASLAGGPAPAPERRDVPPSAT